MHNWKNIPTSTSNEPAIRLVTRRLAEFFKVLSNRRRILILEELGRGERDVSSLTKTLKVSQSTISQQIAVLRTHKLIEERREGRTVFYRLRSPELTAWIGGGLMFAGQESQDAESFLSAIEHARSVWHQEDGSDDSVAVADTEDGQQ